MEISQWYCSWDWRSTLRSRSSEDLRDLEAFLSNMRFEVTGEDKWVWLWDKKGTFSVKQMTVLLQKEQEKGKPFDPGLFWSNLIPIKLNIFLWRFFRDALPTRFNMSKRGLQLQSLACTFCEKNVETLDHCFFNCTLVIPVWKKIWAWWDLKSPLLSSVSSFKRVTQQMGKHQRWGNILLAVCVVASWQIWKWRNSIAFAKGEDSINLKSEDPFPAIQNLSKLWISNRKPNLPIIWDNWCTSPHKPSL